MAIVCDAVLWPLLRAVKPSAEKHVLDVLPFVWPTALEYFKAAATSPAGVVDGSSRLDLGAGAAAAATTAANATRSERARMDMGRIRAVAKGDALVECLLTAAFNAMAAATENHASEWLAPDGKLCAGKITSELRERYDALPSTSTSVERLHAIGRRVDDSGGEQRYENRAGISLAMYNDQTGWLEKKGGATLSGVLAAARKAERLARRTTLKLRAVEAGRAKQEGREEKLLSKRERRAKAAAEKARVEMLALATKYSDLKTMGNDELKDQLKGYKLQGKSGFNVTQDNRAAYVLQVQSLMSEVLGEGCNDLADGDSGVDGRGVRRRQVARDDDGSGGAGKKKKAKSKRKIVSYKGWEWHETEKFEIEKLLGKMVSEGEVLGRGNVTVGTVLYKVLWRGYPPEIATWEEEATIHDDFIDAYEVSLEAGAELESEEESDSEAEE